jgi:hypothetical protein
MSMYFVAEEAGAVEAMTVATDSTVNPALCGDSMPQLLLFCRLPGRLDAVHGANAARIIKSSGVQ